ncbi:HTH-Tnp-Tc3-2 multi-domain protein [Pyrenophora tritici-repentis]|nr:HTH-Tnp-Tc3-2 multi-domain protein [Pyrenophora tritici-repentis]
MACYEFKALGEFGDGGVVSVRVVEYKVPKLDGGFKPNELPIKILPHHVQDAPKPGRPAKQAEEVKEQIFQQSPRSRNLCLYRLEGVESSRIQEDQANEEAWVDTGDEECSS